MWSSILQRRAEAASSARNSSNRARHDGAIPDPSFAEHVPDAAEHAVDPRRVANDVEPGAEVAA